MGEGTVLVVDDERLVRWSLAEHLGAEGYQVKEAGTGREALCAFAAGVDVVLLDYRLPDTDGFELLRQMRARDASSPVILLTGHSSVEHAVMAMKAGAYHYAQKPFDLDAVSLLVANAMRERRSRSASEMLVGESPSMRRVKDLLLRVAKSPASTVLLTGESGTGKDLAARFLHAASARAHGPFVNVTCSALPVTLLESELFGHERGAFTDARSQRKGLLEQAAGGTVFLDEIGEMDLGLQAKLLRFLEDKTFRRLGGSQDIHTDARIVAATNLDLRRAVREGRFREDLYYRLAVLTVEIPPLRDRGGDLDLLVAYFLRRFSAEFQKQVHGLTRDAMDRLRRWAWPGNVRELRNALERAVLLADGSLVSADLIDLEDDREPAGELVPLPPEGIDIRKLEESLVRQALRRAGGNRTRAAALLGMNRDQIRYRIEKFGIED